MLFMKKEFKNYPYRLICTDILIFIIIALIAVFTAKGMFTFDAPFSRTTSFSIYLPFFIVIATLLAFALYVEHKFNKLNFKNILLLLGIVLAINNTIAIIVVPNSVNIEYASSPYVIPVYDKIYSLLYGYIMAFVPFLVASIFSKKVNNKKYLNIVLYVMVGLVSLFTIISFFTDFNAYLTIIKSKFTDFSKMVGSIFGKAHFGLFLFVGVLDSILLHILTKKWRWIILALFFTLISLFTFAKMPILAIALTLLIYLIVNLVNLAMKNKHNLKIILLVSSFVICCGIFVTVFMVNSQSGILFSIKKAINTALENGKMTFSSRMLIWQTSINLLKPYQYIFGFGMVVVAKAISIAYGSHPDCPEKPADRILTTHNTWVQLLMEGGIVYILVYLCYLVILIYAAIKIYKKNKILSVMNIAFIVIILLLGLTDQVILFGDSNNVFLTIGFVVPLMSYFYTNIDKDNIKYNKEIIKQSETINKYKINSKILNYNKNRLLLNSKNIKEK